MPTITPPAYVHEVVVVECAVPSCSRQVQGTVVQVHNAGWQIVSRSNDRDRQRTHVGWCPACAKRFDVVPSRCS